MSIESNVTGCYNVSIICDIKLRRRPLDSSREARYILHIGAGGMSPTMPVVLKFYNHERGALCNRRPFCFLHGEF